MRHPVKSSGLTSLKYTLVASLSLLSTGALFAQSADQGDVSALKAQMERMQKQYEERISAMEGQMKALESKADSGSILNTRILTDASGKEMEGKGPGPTLDESFLKSLTRNFSFSAYVRAGVGFNGNGGPQDFSFIIPQNVGGRFRLGNENDVYMELTWQQAHLLGDGPDVADVTMRFTPAFVYATDKASFVNANPAIGINNGWNYAMREAYLTMSNFIKSAPEITVWGGQRFYDRHNVDMHDYFYDDYSGYGLGFENIDLGFGKLMFAYLGGIRDDVASTLNTDVIANDLHHGGFYLHTGDIRLKDIALFGGKFELIGDVQFLKGGLYQFSDGRPPLNLGDTWGGRIGGIYQYDFGNKSFWQISGFYGVGASSNMGTDIPFNQLLAGYNYNRAFGHVNSNGSIGSSSLRNSDRARATFQVAWNVTDNFVFGAEVHYAYDNIGALVTNLSPTTLLLRSTHGSTNVVGGGIRPVFWLNDWFAIQGQAGVEYVDNARDVSDPRAFGRSGEMGIFTIAPTIKPKGGLFSRPEFRAFATYAIWSNSLKGTFGGTSPITGSTTYSGANQGWVFGVQTEWYF
jgi:maltoporin